MTEKRSVSALYLLREISEIPSITGEGRLGSEGEQRVAKTLQNFFESKRIDTFFIGGNLVARIGAKGSLSKKPQTLLLTGHMDTVPGDTTITYEDGKTIGRGTNDDKGSVAVLANAMVNAPEELITQLETNNMAICAVFTIGEETPNPYGMKFAFRVLKKLYNITAAIATEPRGPEANFSQNGRTVFEMTYSSPYGSQHPARRKGINTNEALAQEIARITRWKTWLKILGRLHIINKDEIPNIETTVMSGGDSKATNVIPESAKAVIDIRTTSRFPEERILRKLRRQRRYPLHTSIVVDTSQPDRALPRKTPKNSPLRRHIIDAFETNGLNLNIRHSPPTNDLGFIDADIHSVVIGPGDSNRSHKNPTDEYILDSEILQFVKIFASLIARTPSLLAELSK